MYIDTHTHLQFSNFDADRAMVIGNAKKAGVKKFIIPGTDIASSLKAVDLAQKHPGVIFPGVGYHPYEAQQNYNLKGLELLAKKSIAIGEIGLDYHQYKGEQAIGKKQNQKTLFQEQLDLALKCNLPVIMHCRDAFDDLFDILDDLPSVPRVVLHCFSGGLQDLRCAVERKFFIGVDGNVTYSKQLQSVVPSIPLSMLLLETDAPYLTPEPHRGTRNEPKYIPLIAKKIADLQKISVKEIEKQTTVNARALFGIIDK